MTNLLTKGQRMGRKAHFHVEGENFDGIREAKVTIEENGKSGLFIVRPKGRRVFYSLPLAEVAAIVLWRDKKATAAAEASNLRRSTRS